MWVEQIRLLLLDAPFIGDFTQVPFLFRPFLMLVTLGVVSGVVGVVVNLRRLEFNAEAMVHSVFPGVVAGAVFGGLDMIIPGAGLVGIVVAVVLTVVGKRGVHTSEAGTAVVLTSFFSLGIVLSLRLGDKSGQLEALMFGRLLEVTNQRLEQSLIVCAVALLMVAVTWKRQIFVAFDRVQAQAQGVNVLAIDLIINVALAAVVIAAASAVGVLLVVGYLVVPGATAHGPHHGDYRDRRGGGGWSDRYEDHARGHSAPRIAAGGRRIVGDRGIFCRASSRLCAQQDRGTLMDTSLVHTSLWEIVRLPLVEICIVGALAGLVGVFAVLKRRVFFAESVTHGTFPGAVLGVVVGSSLSQGDHHVLSLWLFAGAFALCVPLAGVMYALARIPGQSSQAAAGVVLTVGFALGYFLNTWFAPCWM